MLERRRQGQGQGEGEGEYVSCIRVDGEAILPPLVTDQCRAEAAQWRLQAVAVERRLAERRRPRPSHTGPPSTPQAPPHSGADSRASPPRSSSGDKESDLDTSWASVDRSRGPARLTACLLDVADFSDSGCTVLHHHGIVCTSAPGQPQSTSGVSHAPTHSTDPHPHPGSGSGSGSGSSCGPYQSLTEAVGKTETETVTVTEMEREEAMGEPRLVRSGSYTLVNPSPVLLAHLERQSRCVVQKLQMEGSYKPESAQPQPASLSLSASSTSGQSTCDDDFLDCEFATSPDKNAELTWDTLAQSWLGGDVASDIGAGVNIKEAVAEAEGRQEGEGEMDLLGRLQLQQSQHDLLLATQLSVPPAVLALPPVHGMDRGREMVKLSSDGVREEEGECQGGGGEQEEQLRLIQSLLRAAPGPRATLAYCRVIEVATAAAPALVGTDHNHPHRREREEREERRRQWAAGVIGAAARGYLTRRLMHTDRVQSLIQTIHDAVVCAVQLHEVQQLEESDVELHRRLIQQVSAACYAFHDVFFALSAPEQMAIIASDRKRKREKAKKSVIHT